MDASQRLSFSFLGKATEEQAKVRTGLGKSHLSADRQAVRDRRGGLRKRERGESG